MVENFTCCVIYPTLDNIGYVALDVTDAVCCIADESSLISSIDICLQTRKIGIKLTKVYCQR